MDAVSETDAESGGVKIESGRDCTHLQVESLADQAVPDDVYIVDNRTTRTWRFTETRYFGFLF